MRTSSFCIASGPKTKCTGAAREPACSSIARQRSGRGATMRTRLVADSRRSAVDAISRQLRTHWSHPRDALHSSPASLATRLPASDARGCPSARQREGGLGGGGWEDVTRGEAVTELEEALLGRLPGGVDGVKAPAAATGAAQDVGAFRCAGAAWPSRGGCRPGETEPLFELGVGGDEDAFDSGEGNFELGRTRGVGLLHDAVRETRATTVRAHVTNGSG